MTETVGEIAYLGDTFVLNIEWDKPGLPRLVGPFPNLAEAREWGELNIPNGSWEINPLSWPYAAPRGERSTLTPSACPDPGFTPGCG